MGTVGPVPGSADNGLSSLHALNHLAESGVLTVQMGSVVHHDEELAACGIGPLGPGHGQNTGGVLQIVLKAVHGELALDAVARAAHSSAVRVAALDHESGDHPVENGAVIKALADEGDKVVYGVGRDLGIELRLDGALVGLDGDDGILHGKFLLMIAE